MPQTTLSISTRGQGLYEFTREAETFVANHGGAEGLLEVAVEAVFLVLQCILWGSVEREERRRPVPHRGLHHTP